jgi:hypothetical protein
MHAATDMRPASPLKKFHQDRCKCFWLHVVSLPFERAVVRIGRSFASDRIALRIQTGLLPPSMTSVGIVTDAHRLAGERLASLVFFDIGPVVRECMRNGLDLGPHRHQRHQGNQQCRSADCS